MGNTRIALKNRPAASIRPGSKPERHIADLYRAGREDHTQRKFVPAAMDRSLVSRKRGKSPAARPQPKLAAGRDRRSPSTLRLNRSNVRRKPAARGRTQQP